MQSIHKENARSQLLKGKCIHDKAKGGDALMVMVMVMAMHLSGVLSLVIILRRSL